MSYSDANGPTRTHLTAAFFSVSPIHTESACSIPVRPFVNPPSVHAHNVPPARLFVLFSTLARPSLRRCWFFFSTIVNVCVKTFAASGPPNPFVRKKTPNHDHRQIPLPRVLSCAGSLSNWLFLQ